MSNDGASRGDVILLTGGSKSWPPYENESGILVVDAYDLDRVDLDRVRGIIIAARVDQLFLEEQRESLDGFVRGGGRILINGHVQRPFLSGLGTWRKIDFRGAEDLALTRFVDHPVWRGSDPQRLQFTLGGLDNHTPPDKETLTQVGVAGFYGRGYLSPLPENATVIHGLGPVRAPIDVEYPLGAGKVLVHCGNDLSMFMTAVRGTEHMNDQLLAWLRGSDSSDNETEDEA